MQTSITTHVAIVVAALLGGVVGSLFTAELLNAEPASAQGEKAEAVIQRASSFQLVDEKGKKRGEFAIGQDGEPALRLFDSSGFASVTIGLLEDRAGIAIAGPEREKMRATTLIGVDGLTPQIGLSSGNGGPRFSSALKKGSRLVCS